MFAFISTIASTTETYTVWALLSAGVVALWRVMMADKQEAKNNHTNLSEKLDKERETNSKNMVDVHSQIGELKGRQHLAESILPKLSNIEELAKETLEQIKHE